MGMVMKNIILSYRNSDVSERKIKHSSACDLFSKEKVRRFSFSNTKYDLIPGALDYSCKKIDEIFGYELLGNSTSISLVDRHKYCDEIEGNSVSVFDGGICRDLVKLAESDKNKSSLDGVVFPSGLVSNDGNLIKYIVREVVEKFQDKIKHYFSSNFIPVSFTCWQTKGGDSSKNCSHKWHVDTAPSKYLKVIIYLTDYEGGNGGTDFYTSKVSQKSQDVGYSMSYVASRSANLSPLLKAYDVNEEPLRLKYSAGMAVLFDPSFTLHKGISPDVGFSRYAIQIGFIPFPMDYFDIEDNIVSNLKNSGGYPFPVIKTELEVS